MLTLEQKQSALKANGYDPSQFTVDDDGNVFPSGNSNVQPAVGTNDILTKPEAQSPVLSTDSPLKTFGKSALSAAPSTLAGGIGAGVLTAEEVPFAHVAPPWSEIIAGSIGAIGGGYLASKAQKAIEPDAMQQNVAESQAQNPTAATLGALATLPLGGFNPSPTSAVKGLGTLGKLAVGMQATEPEIANLTNVGVGAGVGAGTGVAQSALQGQPIDIKSILENAAIGGLFNKPNAIGNKLGFHSAPPDISSLIREAALSGGQSIAPEATPEQPAPQVQAKPTLSPIDVLRGVSSGDAELSMQKYDKFGNPIKQKELTIPRKNAQESAANIDMLNRDNAPVEDRSSVIEDYKKQIDYERMLHAQANDTLRQTLAAKDELSRQNAAEKQSELAANAMDIQNALRQSQGINRPEVRPEPLTTTPLGRDIPKDFTGVTEQNNREVAAESPADLANRRAEGLGDRYQAPIERTDFEKSMMEKAKLAGLPDKPTKNLFDLMNNWFQAKRGVGLRLSDKVKGMGETSVPTDAKSSVLGYLSHINPNKATTDTLFHEPFHVFYNRLKYSDRPSDQRLVGKFENLVKQLPEYQSKFGNDPHGVEEYITSNQGWEAVRRHVLNDEGGLKSYFKDMLSYIKTRFGSNASEADFRRILDYKFANDPVWTKQHGSELAKGLGTIQDRQQNDRLDKDGYYATVQHDNEVPGSGYIQMDEVRNGQNVRSFSPEQAQKEGLKTPDRASLKLLDQGKHYLGDGSANDVRKQDDRQTPPDDEMVKTAINNLVQGTDNASISEQDANELYRALREQVDWRRAPEIKNLLEQHNFDVLDPDSWQAIKKVYDYTMGKKVTLKQEAPKIEKAPIQKTPVEKITEKPSKEPVIKAKNPAQKHVEKAEDIPTFEKTIALIGHTPEKTPEMRERELFDAKQRWKAVEDTENPKETMSLLADRWRKNPDVNRRQEIAAMMDYLSSKYQVEKPELEGLRRQDERQPELINEKVTKAMPAFEKMHDAIDNPDKAIEEEKNYKEAEANTREQRARQSFAPFLTSRIDKIAERFKDNKVAEYATEQLHKFSGETDYQTGQITNKLIQATRGTNQSSIERIYRHLHQLDDTGNSSINLSTKEQSVADRITHILREPRNQQIAMGLQVKSGNKFRIAGIKPKGYMFNMVDPSVVHEWLENPTSAKARQYDAQYVAHQIAHGETPADAQTMLSDYKGAIGNNASKDTDFGAIRKAEGNGLPWELVDKNFASASSRYGKKAARDLSYFKYIQNDPAMRDALNVRNQFGTRPANPDPISSSKEVKDAMRSVYGVDIPTNPKMMAVARAVGNMIMGPGTAARNILNIPSFISAYVKPTQLPLAFKALANINATKVRAFESNAVKSSFQDFDAAGYYLGNPDPTIRLLDKFSTFARKYQGRDFSDKFEGEYFYSLGELLTTDNIAKAKNGDKDAAKWLDKFGDIVDGGSNKLLTGQVTQDDIQRVAKRFVDSTRGTYGEEGLPGWAMEGAVSPFAALSRFSIEKSNRIYQDVINPLKEGNVRPLLAYTLSSLGVGLATEKLNELLSNKRGNDPTIAEAVASQKPEELFAKAVGLLQLSTFAGVVGDGAKLATDAAMGRANVKQNTLSFPLYDFVTNTLASNIAQAVQALKEKEDPFQVMAKLAQTISTSSVQSLRYVNNNFIDKEDAKRKEKFRDLRVYEQMEGLRTADSGSVPNEFANLGAKKFKETGDVNEAVTELPKLIEKAMNKSMNDEGMIDLEKLRAQLDSIKSNNYQTMPSPDSMPKRFLDYLNYLVRTQGQEEANKTLTDYLTQRTVNQVKGSLVPTL